MTENVINYFTQARTAQIAAQKTIAARKAQNDKVVAQVKAGTFKRPS